MWAVVIALAIVMWVWAAASLHIVQRGFKKTDASLQLVYLAGLTAMGAVGLLLLPYLVLPGSLLSQGWTRELLEQTQLSAVILIGAVAAVGFARAQTLLLPMTRTAIRPAATALAKKRPVKKKP